MTVGNEDAAVGRHEYVGGSIERLRTIAGDTCGAECHQHATGRTEFEDLLSFAILILTISHPDVVIDADDDIWVTDGQDKNGKGQQVFKFSPTGRVLMTLGTAGVAGDGPQTFNRPSDVLVAPNGSIFVADGHGGDTNARIVKFDKDGKFLKTWGKKGSAPGEFDTPHGLVLDPQGRLLVADRGNSRIQVFDQEGKFITEWKQWGRPSGIALDRTGLLYAADSESVTERVNPTVKRGVRIGGLRDGKIRFFVPDPEGVDLPGGGGREGIAVDRDGVVYLAKTGAGGLFRYTKTNGTNTTR